jgi:hypothetical protein
LRIKEQVLGSKAKMNTYSQNKKIERVKANWSLEGHLNHFPTP